MTLSISISPQAEARLRQQAAAAGEDPTVLAAQLLEQAVSQSAVMIPRPTKAADQNSEPISDAVREFDAALDELLAGDTPGLAEASLTYSRDDIYFDHD